MIKNTKNFSTKEKGSTLFLAVIIIGVVLVAGMGAATILVEQIRETRAVEDGMIAFYVAESVIDEADFKDEEELEGVFNIGDREVEYEVIEESDDFYRATLSIENEHYAFTGGPSEALDPPENGNDNDDDDNGPEGVFLTYYDNPLDWDNVTMRYQVEHGDGSNEIYRDDMSESGYEGWKENEILVEEEDIVELITYFCEGTADENEDCDDDGMYGWWDTPHSGATVCVEDEDDKPCRSPLTFVTYYDNPSDWDDVTMRYQVEHGDGSNEIYRDDMSESGYEGWKENEILVEEEDIVELITYFCEGTADENEDCDDDGMYGWWSIDNTRMVCVEEGNDSYCFSPEESF